MSAELTPAEQAAAEALRTAALYTDVGRANAARAVVAAVQPVIEAETFDEMATMVGNMPTVLVQRGSVVERLRKRAARRRDADHPTENDGGYVPEEAPCSECARRREATT